MVSAGTQELIEDPQIIAEVGHVGLQISIRESDGVTSSRLTFGKTRNWGKATSR